MAGVVAAILVSTLVGVGTERRWGEAARDMTSRLLNGLLFFVMPFVTFFNIAKLHVTAGVGLGLLYGHLGALIAAGLGYLVGTRVLRLSAASTGSLMCAALLANTGYLGLPLTVTLLGTHQLAAAVAYDALVGAVLMTVVGFGVGAAFGDRAGSGARERLRAYMLRNPVLIAVVLGLLAPDSLAPDITTHISRVVAVSLAPIGFFALGVHLMHERDDGTLVFPGMSPALAWTIALRLVVAPAVVALCSILLVRAPDAYLLEAAMPCGITTLVIAHAYGLDLRLASASVAWTTGIAVLAATIAAVVT